MITHHSGPGCFDYCYWSHLSLNICISHIISYLIIILNFNIDHYIIVLILSRFETSISVFSFSRIVIQCFLIQFLTPTFPSCQDNYHLGPSCKSTFVFHSYFLNVTHFCFNLHHLVSCSQSDSHIGSSFSSCRL